MPRGEPLSVRHGNLPSGGFREILEQEATWLVLVCPCLPQSTSGRIGGGDQSVNLILPFLPSACAKLSIGAGPDIILDDRCHEIADCSCGAVPHGQIRLDLTGKLNWRGLPKEFCPELQNFVQVVVLGQKTKDIRDVVFGALFLEYDAGLRELFSRRRVCDVIRIPDQKFPLLPQAVKARG